MSGKDAPSQSVPLDELTGIEPDTPYGQSKLAAEKLAIAGGFVPEPVVLRLCMVYGAGAKGNMQKMLRAVSRNRFPPIPDFGNQRSMVHVSDVIQAAILAAERKEAVGQTFIVSDGKAYSTRQMYECICRSLGRKPSSLTIPRWVLKGLAVAGDKIGGLQGRRFVFDSDALEKLTGCAWFSSKKIGTMLGFKPAYDLEKAMPEMVAELNHG
jgi:nucleoside-diphosphate-sugar epimerase